MTNETIFRIIFILLFFSGTSVSIYYRHRAQQQSKDDISLRQEGPFIMVALRLFGLALWISVFAYMINPAWMSWAQLPLPLWLRWTGVAVALISWGLLIWMFRSLGNNITPTVVTRKEHELVTDGPYRWIRHPLYTFATLFYISLGLMASLWLIPIMALVSFPILARRTLQEEEKLLERFGDQYQQYMHRTGRFIPRLG
ncbi:MAG TPA: isoprenylcysteine carboxylmethyltransferase family protein [Anaerolineales bacterium]